MKYLYNNIKINIISGKGGDGIISFYRNKYIKKGGPDGGNGGNGGNIYLKTDKKTNSLNHLKNKKIIYSENGYIGKKKNCTGKNGKIKLINVPINTKITIYKKNKKKKIILDKNNIKILIAKGGKRGLGNTIFKSSINRTPLKCTKGKIGENLYIKLEQIYKIDIFIIGLPNSGKSSLFKILTLKKTKINSYPFTTIYPKINNLKIKNKKTNFNILDTPPITKNIIKKYKKKKNNFFKNIINCKIIIYIIEINKKFKNNINNIKFINKELKIYKKKTKKIKKFIIFNKYDSKNKKLINKIKKKIKNKNIFFISIKKNKGIKKLKYKIYNYLKKKNKN